MSDEATLTRHPGSATGRPVPLWTVRVLYTDWRVYADWLVVLPEGETVIGRLGTHAHDLSFPADRLLSRSHAHLERAGQVLVLHDHDSRNGTHLNGERLVGSQRLADGDLIRLGDTFLLVRQEPPELTDIQVSGISGVSVASRRLRSMLVTVAGAGATVVLLGESGTGKGVCARALHELSGRRGRFVHVNCAAIPENLAESAFFGHVAGAFTGATGATEGFFRAAQGGTLFMDEVGDLPLPLQPKLLHVLDDQRVTPVGATSAVACDVRVIVATNVDLVAAVRRGRFRGDLFARLAELVLEVPPLRSRREDILPLLHARLRRPSPPLSPELVAHLLAHPWPFNVREVERMATELSVRGVDQALLEWSMISHRLESFAALADPSPERAERETAVSSPETAEPRSGPPTHDELVALLRAHRGVVAEIARQMDRSTKQVYRWLSRHNIDPDDYRA